MDEDADFGEHEYALDTDEAETLHGDKFQVWRWLCACGARGDWRLQPDNEARHGWLKHVGTH